MFDKILGLFTYEVDELVLADGPARDNEDSGEDLRQLRGSHLLVFTSRRAVSFFPRGPIYTENLLGLPLSGSSHHSSEFFDSRRGKDSLVQLQPSGRRVLPNPVRWTPVLQVLGHI